MNTNKNNTELQIPAYKRINPRYIVVYEDTFEALTPSTYKVYTALRFNADYSQECSSVRRSTAQIAKQAGVSVRKAFEGFNELEDVGLLKRESNEGYQTVFWVAQHLNHFSNKTLNSLKDPVLDEDEFEEVPVQNLDTPLQNLHTPLQNLHTPPAESAYQDLNNLFNNIYTNKTLVDSANTTMPAIVNSIETDLPAPFKSDSLFMAFYSQYPNKQKPALAHRQFLKLKPTPELVAKLIEDVTKRVAGNWRGRDKSKIPHPATYLNSREWEGEIYSAPVVETLVARQSYYPQKNSRLRVECEDGQLFYKGQFIC